MPEFRIRLEFDVEVDNPSFIDAAFEAADWLKQRAAADRFDYLEFKVARNTYEHGVTEFQSVDLEEIQADAEGEGEPDAPPWIVVPLPYLPSGRRAAWPFVVMNGHDGRYTRTLSGTGRIIRYSNSSEAQRIADQLNESEKRS